MKTKNRIYSALLAGMLMLSSAGITVTADDTVSEYDATNAYVLDYDGAYSGHRWQYFSPYYPAYTYDTDSKNASCVAFTLYNTISKEVYPAYCTDIDTGLIDGTDFQRLNLEDSTYASAGAGVIRSIMINGFPNTPVKDLAADAGVEGLTVGEAVAATQAAVWQAAHGGLLTFTDFVSYVDLKWSSEDTEHYDVCNAEIADGYAENNKELIESHIEKVFNYLTSLEPLAPNDVSVSARSFKSWKDPIYSENEEEGTYDISVKATIDVEMVENDSLTLSAVLGDGTYFGSTPLENGSKEYTVTIENVPADALNSDITLAIDGKQTVTDVFLFDAEGNRTTSQSLVAYCKGQQLPVHAEVVVEAERVLHVYKYAPIDEENDLEGTGEATTVEGKYPLEGISFTIYKVPSSVDISGETPTADELSAIQAKTNYVATITTDADGYASFSFTRNGFDDGVYLIVEEEDRRIEKPADPFYVYIPMISVDGDELLYQVYVYPKNDVVDEFKIEKDVIELGNDLASVPADAPFTWIISATIPVDIAGGKEYVITDELDTKLDYVGNVVVNVEKAEGVDRVLATLVEDTDYTLTVNDNDLADETVNDNDLDDETVNDNDLDDETVNDSFAIALTSAGMQKVADAVGLDNVNCRIRVYFDTILSDKAGVEELIPNDAVIEYTNSIDQLYDKTSDEAKVYTGFALIDKYDSVNKDKKLAGAEFAVYREATDEEIAEEANKDTEETTAEEIAEDTNKDTEETTAEEIAEETNKDKFNTTLIEGKTLIRVPFYTAKNFEGLELVYSVTTGDNGSAVIAGLADGTYYLVETKAPVGYNMLTTPKEFTIDAVQGEESGVEVDITYQECELEVENCHGSVLPSTGGIGTTIFYCAGAVLAVGAFVLLITKKRMSKEV